jgi:hypothetical protein
VWAFLFCLLLKVITTRPHNGRFKYKNILSKENVMDPVTTTTAEAPAGVPQAFDLNTANLEQFEDKLKTDTELMNEYTSNPNDPKFTKFNEQFELRRTGKTQQPDGSAAATPAQQAAPAATTETAAAVPPESQAPAEEMVELTNVKIPKGLLSKYLAGGRGAPDAVIEALKSIPEADNTIKNFRTRDDNHINDNLALRKELIKAQQDRADAQLLIDSLKKQRETASAQPIPSVQPKIEEIDFDVLNDIDLLDMEQHGKVEKAKSELAKARKLIEASRTQGAQPAAAASVQTQPAKASEASAAPQPAPVSAEMQKSIDALKKLVDDKEFADIAALQAEVPELRTKLPFEVLDKAVANFNHSVANAAGTPGNIGGAVELYFSQTPEGERFRASCKQHGVEAPEGYEIHNHIVGKIRPLRLKNIQVYREKIESKTGGQKLEDWEVLDAPGISYTELYSKVPAYQPPAAASAPQPGAKLQKVIEQHVANTNKPKPYTVPEVPPSMSTAPIVDIGSLPATEFNRLSEQMTTLGAGSFTKQDAVTWSKICEYVGQPCDPVVLSKLKE